MKYSKFDQEHALESLKNLVHENDTVYTILRHVSASGMMRVIDMVIFIYDENRKTSFPYHIAYNAGVVMGESYDRNNRGLKISGCGMDMGFSAVYNLASVLFGDGYKLKQEWL